MMSKWISVKDRLPDKGKGVLGYCVLGDDIKIQTQMYCQKNNEWCDWCGEYFQFVTHWMPLPEPPKDE